MTPPEHDLGKIYEQFNRTAGDYVDRVRVSTSDRRIVAAGPGTGKTHLFKAIIADRSNALVLTFINALVEDLHIQLPKGTTVRTLHGFARSILTTAGQTARVYDDLTNVIEDDAKILGVSERGFASKIRNFEDRSVLKFYLDRRKYYGDYYSHDDLIFAAVELLKSEPDRIKSYDQILVDEFQDFNTLDVELIDLLASKSPVLVAGDDDQSLYGFRDSTYRYLRDRHSDGNETRNSNHLAFHIAFGAQKLSSRQSMTF
jgi:superfamily I DNA/RNA helicase